jgi:Fe-S cluster assembly iron-binding protein IscA
MVLDEPQKTDVQLETEGISFLIEGITAERFEKLTIDYTNNWIRRGFSISPYGVTFSE